jgi:uncharacterized protein YjbI with pentapeptide repeats
MSTPDILADRFPSATCDTPTSRCHVIIARAELPDRRHLGLIAAVFIFPAWLTPREKARPGEKPLAELERLKLQNDIRASVFQAIAGIAVFVGAFIAWQQLQSNRTEAQTTNTLVTQEQVAQEYDQAVSELANSRTDIQIGGMYALQQIFEAGQNPSKAPTNPVIVRIRLAVFGLLSAYIRTHVPYIPGSPVCDQSVSTRPALSERAPGVQVALGILGARGFGASNEPNLLITHVDLRNADLLNYFDYTDFSYSDLGGVNFREADLKYANFMHADLCGANLTTAQHYSSATFTGAVADKDTRFPKGFNPHNYGIVMK